MTKDEKFIAEFEACRWPLEKWHHRDHIKLAYLYLRRYTFAEAAKKLGAGIRAHNAAHGIMDTPRGGYHETMTQAWIRLVYFTLCEYGPAETADAFFDNSPHLSQKKSLRYFYSPEVFMSPRAKAEFVEPDLTAFPCSRKICQP